MVVASKSQMNAHFFLAERGEGFKGFSHLAIMIAEGLLDLGWAISSNVVSWRESPEEPHLFPGSANGQAQNATLIIFEEDFFKSQSEPHIPPECFETGAALVYLDGSDLTLATRMAYSPALRRLDLILRTHYASIFRYPGNFKALPFGISKRIARACQNDNLDKDDSAMWNFRHNQHPHSTRVWAEKNVKPIVGSRIPLSARARNTNQDEDTPFGLLMRAQTDGRHFTSYYEEMKRTLVCACFGGWFVAPVPQKEAGFLCLRSRGLITRLGATTHAIAQWDSWRMWEAFAAGAAMLHFDFDECGFLLGGPSPEPMKHYVPVNLSHPEKALGPVLEDRQLLLKIGQAGREWALRHYGSKSVAERMLTYLGIGY